MVSSTEFQAYLEKFHAVYRSKLEEAVPEEYRASLLRWPYLRKSRIHGFVSTTYGVGYEYVVADGNGIEMNFGSHRADAEFFRCSPKQLERNGNVGILLSGRDFKIVNCSFAGRLPLRLDGAEASATVVDLTWTFGGETHQIAYAEMFSDRSQGNWSVEKAIERAMDEVLQATVAAIGMDRLRMSVGDYLERFKKGYVLLLGDFSDDGTARLDRMREVLERFGYYGFTLRDVRDVPAYDLRQKLTAVAPVCRFVVVDDSSRGGQAAELPIIEMLRATSIVLRRRGADSTFVTRGLSATSKVIREYEYDDDDLDTVLLGGIQWAESMIRELEAESAVNYPWRSPV